MVVAQQTSEDLQFAWKFSEDDNSSLIFDDKAQWKQRSFDPWAGRAFAIQMLQNIGSYSSGFDYNDILDKHGIN